MTTNIKVVLTAQATVFVENATTDQEAIDCAINNTRLGDCKLSGSISLGEVAPEMVEQERQNADVRCIKE